MDVRRIEDQPDLICRNGEAHRHPRREFHVSDAKPRETRAAEIVDAIDLGGQKPRSRHRHVDEFRPVHNLESLGQLIAALGQPAGPRNGGTKQWLKAM